MPKISVIMPLYNAEQFVSKAIESILQQSYKDFELLIVDDCSTDNSLDIVSKIRDSRIKIVRNEKNEGISFSRNRGLALASGEYIALMDDDDLTVPFRFDTQVNYLNVHSDIDVVGGRHCIIDENDQIIRTCGEPLNNPLYIRADMMLYDSVANGSAMFRADFIKRNRINYHDGWLGMEDYHFWIQCSARGRITNLSENLLYWRKSGNNETVRRQNLQSKERSEKFSNLHKYAFELNGYLLLNEEYEIINKMFPEAISSTIVNRNDIEKLYNVLLKIIHQSKELRVENAKEVEIMCRRRFSKRLEFSELWF
ncbi:MAG: glycosyltransferase [Paenibacillaceae bacterium]|nr:glycosyltransferase [Paenibacillaceae bacterium]